MQILDKLKQQSVDCQQLSGSILFGFIIWRILYEWFAQSY